MHVDKGVKHMRATRPGFTGGAELRVGSIEVETEETYSRQKEEQIYREQERTD